jgi:hypothetical protein
MSIKKTLPNDIPIAIGIIKLRIPCRPGQAGMPAEMQHYGMQACVR